MNEKPVEFKEMKVWGKIKLWWSRNEKYISLTALLVFLAALWYSINYLPILLPDKFTETPMKATEIPNLIVYYPARVVDGKDYEAVLHFIHPKDGGKDDYEFSLTSNWNDDIAIQPSSIKFDGTQDGTQKEIVTLDLEPSSNLPDNFTLTVKQEKPISDYEEKLLIQIVEVPDNLALVISFLISFGALLLGYLIPIVSRLISKFKRSV